MSQSSSEEKTAGGIVTDKKNRPEFKTVNK